jgi:hypothetical protein
MEQLRRYRFLFDGPVAPGYSRIHSTKTIPFSFKTLLASVDVIMTKPGYGTIVEAIALQLPVLYVRRYNFADEQPLVDYLHRYGRGIELSFDDLRKAAGKQPCNNRWTHRCLRRHRHQPVEQRQQPLSRSNSEPSARTTPTTFDRKEFRPCAYLLA